MVVNSLLAKLRYLKNLPIGRTNRFVPRSADPIVADPVEKDNDKRSNMHIYADILY